MEKIKDITKVLLTEGTILVEIIQPKRVIMMPDGTEDKDSYGVVIAASPSVKDLGVGDIVIKHGGSVYGYTINQGKSNQKVYAVMFRGNVNIAVHPDNFIDPDKLTAKVNI